MATLSGKKALVTGGSRGIGAAIAIRFAKEGADVAVTYSSSPDAAEKVVQQIEALGQNGYAIKADASKPEALTEPVEQAISQLGGLDILVNNAGVFGENAPIQDAELEAFDKVVDINIRAVFETTRIAAAHMKSGASIINTSSVLGERGIFPGLSIYNSSKFAVTGLTRSWALDLGENNIRVNAIQPGPIDTEMNPADGESGMEQQTALKRYGKPEEVAALAAFLASDESSYITGATINIDGGMNA